MHHLQAGQASGQVMGGYVRHAWGPQLASSCPDWRQARPPFAPLWQESLPACAATSGLWALETQGSLLSLPLALPVLFAATAIWCCCAHSRKGPGECWVCLVPALLEHCSTNSRQPVCRVLCSCSGTAQLTVLQTGDVIQQAQI